MNIYLSSLAELEDEFGFCQRAGIIYHNWWMPWFVAISPPHYHIQWSPISSAPSKRSMKLSLLQTTIRDIENRTAVFWHSHMNWDCNLTLSSLNIPEDSLECLRNPTCSVVGWCIKSRSNGRPRGKYGQLLSAMAALDRCPMSKNNNIYSPHVERTNSSSIRTWLQETPS